MKRIRTIKDKKRLRAVEFRSLWEMVDQNGKVIISDYSGPSREGSVDKRATILGKDLAMARGTKIDPGAIIDTRSGPVIIGEKVWIKSNSVIEGPAYIGPETIIEGAKVRPGTTIGKNCRIGGEVETSIILDFTNKHHDGFIGHSYIGSWVNLGALTTNSDLKNNYHQVRIRYKDKSFETGLLKVGCFIGDHVKTGIGTLIPTGCVIGPFTNVFGGGMVERFIPAFRWGSPGKYQDYDLERAIETAKLVMSRRGVRLDKNYEKVIRTVYQRERTGK
ncbi:MAG TPA: hypothetical protein EYP24_00925 [bacterium (Candidatus Stahlbacteria)]|nr:hypothetical protein [Candidatus Stahlbacteria bacterium]